MDNVLQREEDSRLSFVRAAKNAKAKMDFLRSEVNRIQLERERFGLPLEDAMRKLHLYDVVKKREIDAVQVYNFFTDYLFFSIS